MMSKALERITNGVIKENPTFVLLLGMCPTLAVTTSAINGFGMGVATMAVLVMSNLIISLLRNIIPDKVRIPAYIVIIATFVTVVQMLMNAYAPQSLNNSLGIYIPLIVVNCIIMGRAESYASKNSVILSVFDGIGMGLGFTLALTIIGLVRELLGNGSVFGIVLEEHVEILSIFEPAKIFVLAPGAFFVLAAITAFRNKLGVGKRIDTDSCQNDSCASCARASICKGHTIVEEEEVQ